MWYNVRAMPRPLTLFTGQWADLPLDVMCAKASPKGGFGYDGLELACWGDHFNVQKALASDQYCLDKWKLLEAHGLTCYAISNHLVGQAVCDVIDERHKAIVPAHVWGDGRPEGVRERAAKEMMDTARAARKFFDLKPGNAAHGEQRLRIVNGFTGSPIWHVLYAFPPTPRAMIEEGFREFARRWEPILEVFARENVHFALEVHPTEIAFDVTSAERTLDAIGHHPNFGFNFDPSHFGYQGVDAIGFIRRFASSIRHVHIKDAWWSDRPTRAGVFGGHTEFGDADRYWDFRSPGRGRIDFESILRALNHAGYAGPLSVEWEDPMMDREHGAKEAAAFVRKLDFTLSKQAFDAAFGG